MDWKAFSRTMEGKVIGIGGNRWIDRRTAKKVETITRAVIRVGCALVTGGAEGVDHVVLRTCLQSRRRVELLVFLPYTIEQQYTHYRKLEGKEKAQRLYATLRAVQKKFPHAIHENRRQCTSYRKAADARNRAIERRTHAFIMVKPRGSKGSMDAVKAVRIRHIPHFIVW